MSFIQKIPFWALPCFSAAVWLSMLLTLIITWAVEGKPYYFSMSEGQTIPFISDVGADWLKPVFVALCTVTVVVFDASLITDRWLRHRGLLARAASRGQKILAALAIVAAIGGAVGLICLSVFDTLRHERKHAVFLGLFILGYVFSAVFLCVQYNKLGNHYPDIRLLRISYMIKLSFIITELSLVVAFGISVAYKKHNVSAVIEWVIALVFTFYLLSFAIDFLPLTDSERKWQARLSPESPRSPIDEKPLGIRPEAGDESGAQTEERAANAV